jgi:hypothetical protein
MGASVFAPAAACLLGARARACARALPLCVYHKHPPLPTRASGCSYVTYLRTALPPTYAATAANLSALDASNDLLDPFVRSLYGCLLQPWLNGPSAFSVPQVACRRVSKRVRVRAACVCAVAAWIVYAPPHAPPHAPPSVPPLAARCRVTT